MMTGIPRRLPSRKRKEREEGEKKEIRPPDGVLNEILIVNDADEEQLFKVIEESRIEYFAQNEAVKEVQQKLLPLIIKLKRYIRLSHSKHPAETSLLEILENATSFPIYITEHEDIVLSFLTKGVETIPTVLVTRVDP